MHVAFGAIRESSPKRASQFSPRVTASDVPALNLSQLPSNESLHLSTCLSISFGGADDAPARIPGVNPQVHRNSAPHH